MQLNAFQMPQLGGFFPAVAQSWVQTSNNSYKVVETNKWTEYSDTF